jgi:hypothetical protein
MNARRLTVARRVAVLGFAFLLSLVYPARESRASTYTWTQFGNGSFDWWQLGEQWRGHFRGR